MSWLVVFMSSVFPIVALFILLAVERKGNPIKKSGAIWDKSSVSKN